MNQAASATVLFIVDTTLKTKQQTLVHVINNLQVETLFIAFQLCQNKHQLFHLGAKNQRMSSSVQIHTCMANDKIFVLLSVNIDDKHIKFLLTKVQLLNELTVNVCNIELNHFMEMT